MAVANMEHINAKEKTRWGRALLADLKPNKSKPQHLWALSRIGARELLYGPVDRVIPAGEVSAWIKTLLKTQWRDPKPVIAALSQMARKTGDRTRDLDPSVVEQIIFWVEDKAPDKKWAQDHIKYLQEVVSLAKHEEHLIFGETLPSGIILHSQ